MKGSFCEEFNSLFDKFPKYQLKILLGDFYAKFAVSGENIFKTLFGNGSLFGHFLMERQRNLRYSERRREPSVLHIPSLRRADCESDWQRANKDSTNSICIRSISRYKKS
jgi:hypothetical protein